MPVNIFANLDLEPWIKIYCALLASGFLVSFGVMGFQSLRLASQVRATLKILKGVGEAKGEERRRGRSSESYDSLREASKLLPRGGGRWWAAVDNAIERYVSPEAQVGQTGVGYFATTPIDELVTVEDVATGYSFSFFQSFPGILTSLGLLGTFIALLLGLNGLRVNDAGTVDGLKGLIANLSGKFLTSITALTLSVIFVLAELRSQAILRAWRNRLVQALSDVLPYLSTSRIMLDIQRESVKQSSALRNISSDVIDKFANVFRDDLSSVFAQHISGSMATRLQTELGPTLVKLTATMHELTGTVSRIESQKQESVVGQLRGLTESLERSLKDSFTEMGRQFRDALAGSTKDEFGALADVVKGSAGMLAQMNQGFAGMQAAVQGIVEEARTSTSAQMRAGVEQTERLNQLVEGLMIRLSESANQNYQQVTGLLASVVTQLSERVEFMSSELVQAVAASTAQSQQSASDTVRQAGDWSAQTSKQLTDLLSMLERKSDQFDRAGQTLLAAQATLHATLEQNHHALSAMGTAASEVKSYSASLAGFQRQVEEGQKTQTQLATMSRESIGKLVEAAGRHDEFLARYQQTFDNYRGVFEGLDQEIASILETILDRLQSYNRSVEVNFRTIVDSANNVMPRMAGVIKQSADDLHDQLDELSDVLSKGTRSIAVATGTGIETT